MSAINNLSKLFLTADVLREERERGAPGFREENVSCVFWYVAELSSARPKTEACLFREWGPRKYSVQNMR